MNRTSILVFFSWLLMSTFWFAGPANAYVDPGSGSVIITTILGVFAAIGFTMRKYFYRIRRLFRKDSESEAVPTDQSAKTDQ